MKLFALAYVLVAAVTSVLGQTIELGAPAEGQLLCPGKDFTVEVVKPGSASGCTEVGIAISIACCENGECPTPDQKLGHVLYAGEWDPTQSSSDGLYQNFTFQLPSSMPTGPAVVTVTHLSLVGDGPTPLLDYAKSCVTIQPE